MTSESSTTISHPGRKPRLLWANVSCLLDTSSGASITVREMLLQLVKHGYEVYVLGTTVFDHERGTAGLQGHWQNVHATKGKVVAIKDGLLTHNLWVTASTQRPEMTCQEELAWFALYQQALDNFKPDLVFYYGGQPLDLLIPIEARARGVPTAFHLTNGNYTQKRWCRDVDLILTDSGATAQRYQRQFGIRPVAVGKFIDPLRVVAHAHTRERLLFVNPAPEKGAALVIRLAMLLEKRRPDLLFEVVESRGNWTDILRSYSLALGQPRETLDNVVLTPNSSDMRPIYSRARLLLAPSLWWESGARVLAEAMLNGIPAITTDYGGSPEMVQDGGIILRLGTQYHDKPYTRIPSDEALEPVLQGIEALFDDQARYAELASRAYRVGQTHHTLNVSTQRLLQALQPYTAKGAGDTDPGSALRQLHRHGLDDRPAMTK